MGIFTVLYIKVFWYNIRFDKADDVIMTARISIDSPHYKNVDSMVERASHIIRGELVSARVEWIDILDYEKIDSAEYSHPDIKEGINYLFTVYTFSINDVYKGIELSDNALEVKVFGGETDDIIMVFDEKTMFHAGFEYVLFLQTYNNIPADLLNPYQCAYIYEDKMSKQTPKETVLRSLSDENDLVITYDDLTKIKSNNIVIH
jgi:hypothetical protein